MDTKKLLPIGLLIIVVVVFGGILMLKSTKKKPMVSDATPGNSVTSDGISSTPGSSPATSPGTTTRGDQVQNNGPISLNISSPTNKSTVSSSNVTVKGKTTPKAEVFVNDTELVADSTGNFSANISLDEGENSIIVVVTDSEGNVAEQELVVTYNNS